MFAPALQLAIACAAMFALTSTARVTAERFSTPYGPLDVMFCRPVAEPAGLVIAAHGTNSHKEVFLPLAWELAARGWALAAVDSRTLSTAEGVEERAQELIAVRDALAGWMRRPRLGFVGHSDGVAPALAASRLAPGARPPVIALGSTFTAAERAGVDLRAYAGALDQVFPVTDIRAAAAASPAVPVQVSWLSDHFLEQYDPVLVPAMASALVGPGKVTGAPERCAGRVLAFAWAVIAALVLGARVAPQETGARALVVASLFLWVAGAAVVWPAAVAVALIVGVVLGPRTLARCGRLVVIVGVLMLVNVTLAAPVVRAEAGMALPWLPVMVPWFLLAWVPKAALFVVSVLTATGPAGVWVPPGLLVLGLIGLARPGGGDRVVWGSNPEGGQGSARVAIGLFALMAVLWGVRFAQGMVQADVLSAVATNFGRTLVLPTIYLAALATGRLKRW